MAVYFCNKKTKNLDEGTKIVRPSVKGIWTRLHNRDSTLVDKAIRLPLLGIHSIRKSTNSCQLDVMKKKKLKNKNYIFFQFLFKSHILPLVSQLQNMRLQFGRSKHEMNSVFHYCF